MAEMQVFNSPAFPYALFNREGETMTATYKRIGKNYMPVIMHHDGRREVIAGPVLGMRRTALKYAQIEINERNTRKPTLTNRI